MGHKKATLAKAPTWARLVLDWARSADDAGSASSKLRWQHMSTSHWQRYQQLTLAVLQASYAGSDVANSAGECPYLGNRHSQGFHC